MMRASDYTKAVKGWTVTTEAWYTVTVPNVRVTTNKDKKGVAVSFDLQYKLGDSSVRENIPAHHLVLMHPMPLEPDRLTVSFTRVERTAEFQLAASPVLTSAGLLKLTRSPDGVVFYTHPSRTHFRKK